MATHVLTLFQSFFYIENYLNDQGTPSAVVSALSNDLDKHNQECIEFNGGYGYEN